MKHFQLILWSLGAAFLILTLLVKLNPTSAIDLAVTRQIQMIQNPAFNWLMVFLSWLGFFPQSYAILVLGMTGLFWLKLKKESLLLAVSTIGVYYLSQFLKGLVERPRPDPTIITQVGTYLNPDSFPSGHVLFYIGFFGYLLYLAFSNLKHGFLRSSLEVFLILLVILIGVSRIYLGAHWFSDVLGSYLVGTIWLSGIISLHHRLKRKVQ